MKIFTRLLVMLAMVGLSDGKPRTNGSKTHWSTKGENDINRAIELEGKLPKTKAKNVILVVGDGMGVSTLTAARWYKSELYKTPIDNTQLSWEELPYSAFSKTYNTNAKVPDSAGTATAMMSGEKTRAGILGYDHTVVRQTCQPADHHKVKTVLDYAMEEDKYTGIVTTTSITHATPAAAYAHISERFWCGDSDIPEKCKGKTRDIALQLVEDNPNINVLFGGGRRYMLPNDTADPVETHLKGLRQDGHNLIDEWIKHKKNKGLEEGRFKTVFDQKDFDTLDTNEVNYVFGLMGYNHLSYNVSRTEVTPGQPSLAQMTAKAIQVLQNNPEGYFLLVEEGQIDWGHHLNQAKKALDNTVGLDETVRVIMTLTDPEDTLLIVTADHSHTFFMAGYPQETTQLFEYDEGMTGTDGKPYLSLMYGNGPGYRIHRTDENGTEIPRKNLTEFGEKIHDLSFVSDAAIGRRHETHAGEDVSIHARGPWSHLFHTTHDQTYIGHVMIHAACFSDSQADHCSGTEAPVKPQKTCSASTVTLGSTSIMLTCLSVLLII